MSRPYNPSFANQAYHLSHGTGRLRRNQTTKSAPARGL